MFCKQDIRQLIPLINCSGEAAKSRQIVLKAHPRCRKPPSTIPANSELLFLKKDGQEHGESRDKEFVGDLRKYYVCRGAGAQSPPLSSNSTSLVENNAFVFW